MGRPPGVKNGTGGNGGAKNGSKGGTGGKAAGRPCSSSNTTSGGATDKEKGSQDRSQLNFPYDIRLNGYASLHNAVTKGTPKIKRILTEECDYIMECRVCKNLFRSLTNFISHKLNYCKKAFDSTWCIGLSNLIHCGEYPAATSFNIEYEVDPELVLINSTSDDSSSKETSCMNSEPMHTVKTNMRSVAEFYNELAEKTKAQNMKPQSQPRLTSTNDTIHNPDSNNVIKLQLKPLVIPTTDGDNENCNVVSGGGMKSVIVQQHVVSSDPSICDNSCTKPMEIVRKDTAILGPDGKVLCTAPGKGIEQVVSRLTAQLKALEEKEARKMAAVAKNAIICDVCKTVFDSVKALRQHKRESLDCGKIWGFKSCNEKLVSVKPSASLEDSLASTKRTKPSSNEVASDVIEPTDRTEETELLEYTRNVTTEPARTISIPKFISSPKSRRPSHYSTLANKNKRNSSLSPAKKIKMKYSKLESSASSSSRDFESGRRQGINSYSCNRCSSSFTTKHEISMHLALCTGVINYAHLKESEPPREKIRISLRNDFSKPSTPIPTPQASPCFNSIISDSHNLLSRQRKLSGASTTRDGGTLAAEVNNNKQYKSSFQQIEVISISSSASSEEEDGVNVVASPSPLLQMPVQLMEEEGDSDITSHDSGVSSTTTSSTKKKTQLLSSVVAKKVKFSNISSSVASPKKLKPAASSVQMGNVGGLTGTLEVKKTLKKAKASTKCKQEKQRSVTLNLRKTVHSRIRKCRRVMRSPPQEQQKKQKKLKVSNSNGKIIKQ